MFWYNGCGRSFTCQKSFTNFLHLRGSLYKCLLCSSLASQYVIKFCSLIPGKTDFSTDEDAHVIADCVKVYPSKLKFRVSIRLFVWNYFQNLLFIFILQYILRELPSSPVPASCCNALLEAFSKFIVLMLGPFRLPLFITWFKLVLIEERRIHLVTLLQDL